MKKELTIEDLKHIHPEQIDSGDISIILSGYSISSLDLEFLLRWISLLRDQQSKSMNIINFPFSENFCIENLHFKSLSIIFNRIIDIGEKIKAGKISVKNCHLERLSISSCETDIFSYSSPISFLLESSDISVVEFGNQPVCLERFSSDSHVQSIEGIAVYRLKDLPQSLKACNISNKITIHAQQLFPGKAIISEKVCSILKRCIYAEGPFYLSSKEGLIPLNIQRTEIDPDTELPVSFLEHLSAAENSNAKKALMLTRFFFAKKTAGGK